ncbi:SDR family oxidoreductase [Pseudonocardia kunmingensis]|uniref:NAD(P)-dependent dehydrogenase (Short-subunit alcohol dehydrogenase family) n=1 Tax=Pseudonocardia kunmingensis TaxID=630975 RepID=A0A543DPL4_9PSEU|nr:SDR family oxidoreductase [Pseudonocardia kunmingensis]TQM11245.1 NAD(P)-dependent dehydrogenase (short-subunit alcohol dehydrogenase family) [Pseudonocardia kunmingensis]
MSETSRPLADRVAIITGAGRGIGREHALAYARAGAAVVVNDLGGGGDGTGGSTGPAADVVAEIEAEGGSAVSNGDDISRPESAARLVHTAVEEFGRLDVLVNNAGILRDKTLLNTSLEDWEAVLGVHLRGTFLTSQAAGRYWRDRAKESGPVDARIINTSSGSGLFGNFGQSNYASAKAGIASLTIVTSLELGRYGVTANAIAPVAKTRLLASTGRIEETVSEGFDPYDPKHVSPLVVWLGSPESRDVTGRVFSVVGGYVGVVEGWHIGPTLHHEGPLTFDEISKELPEVLAAARPNATPRESHPYARES